MLGAIGNFEAQVVLQPGCTGVFCRAGSLPFYLCEQVGKRLAERKSQGVITPVSRSDWATLLVVVPKKRSDQICLCGEYKITVNPVLKVDHYPLPQPEEMFTAIWGDKVFCVIDLSSAYQEMVLCKESRHIPTVNMHKELYQYNRLPYGIASPAGASVQADV